MARDAQAGATHTHAHTHTHNLITMACLIDNADTYQVYQVPTCNASYEADDSAKASTGGHWRVGHRNSLRPSWPA
jgi:hypothetical protein